MTVYAAGQSLFLRTIRLSFKQEGAALFPDSFCCGHPALGEDFLPACSCGMLLNMEKECRATVWKAWHPFYSVLCRPVIS